MTTGSRSRKAVSMPTLYNTSFREALTDVEAQSIRNQADSDEGMKLLYESEVYVNTTVLSHF